MNRVQQLSQNADGAARAFITFTRIARIDNESLFCFFEGEDEKYYGIRIDLLQTRKYHPISCGGKKNVLEVKKTILTRHEYKLHRVVFFIDLDFDQPLHSKDYFLYETPCYSIENFYCTDESVKKILSAEFGQSEHAGVNGKFEEIYLVFKESQKQFHSLTKFLNVYIKAHRLYECSNNSAKLNLNNIKIRNLITIKDDGTVCFINGSLDLVSVFPNGQQFSNNELEAADTFNEKLFNYYFRGKFEIEFLFLFLNKLRTWVSIKGNKLHIENYSIKLQLSEANLVSGLSQYATTPDCLKNFISNYEKYFLEKHCN